MLLPYISEVSKHEAKFILYAFERRKFDATNNTDLCSHSHELDFLYQHFFLITQKDKKLNISIPLVYSLKRKFKDIVTDEPELKSLIMEFMECTRHMKKSRMLLCCFFLLVNYHKKEECSEYLSLALKLKLLSYSIFVGNSFHSFPNDVMKVLVCFLQYISRYKCKQVLFKSFIDVFVESSITWEFEDYLQPVLSEVLEAAHELRFNFFRLWDTMFILMRRKYVQRSIVEDVKRYLILVKYGYEDRRYSRAFLLYDCFITIYDMHNLFGFHRRIIRRRSNKTYRSYQMLHLYIQAYYDENNYGEEIYEETLRMLWKSIPDPFLTKKQFLSSFGHSDKFPEFVKAWKWYLKIVLNGVESEKSPRSLKHLARCFIRRVLTESVQTPTGY